MENFDDFTTRDWQETRDGGPVRIAVVGLGRFAHRRALPAIRDAELCEATVAVDISVDEIRPIAKEFDIDHVISANEFHQGKASDSYDAVYVATPNTFHSQYVETAASLKKHVLCEKPLEISAERARQMVKACTNAGVTLMTGYRMQIEPIVRRMRTLIEEGFIGDPIHFSGKFSNQPPIGGGPLEWRTDPDISGGGALMDLGIYPLNTIRFLLGDDPETVYGSTTTHNPTFENVDEHISFELNFPRSITASCTASLNAYPSSYIEVIGTEGEIRVTSAFGGITPKRISANRRKIQSEYTGPIADEVVEEFDYFAHSIITDSQPEPDGWDGLADLVAIEAIYESAKSGKRVKLQN
ncbi:Gfo/Idh/MocA family oxidoreductase [Halobacteria archaeon AArc-m2/3/4]|uniref:Gfo/Idh/MocA family oxidoreductase n=1 Tax=Natronoglomus mannanivorans TaxID=2979990 RepID=A0ABT2QK91_9EURY|nr:Gfo/Idh/MocA family oxidoreductase [Halobacteria archaeon AArc-m2/3/4]